MNFPLRHLQPDPATLRVLGIARPTIAWVLAGSGALLVIGSLVFWQAMGILQPIHLAYITALVTGLVGAMVVSQHPRHAVGWLMLIASFATALGELPFDYGYYSTARQLSLPFATIALWVASWAWIPGFGMFGLVAVRFPDGRVPKAWRFVDWISFTGIALFVLGLALTPGPLYPTYIVDNPFGLAATGNPARLITFAGVAVNASSALCSMTSLVWRYRHAGGEHRQQLKWIAIPTAAVALALVYGTFAIVGMHSGLIAGLTPFAAALTLVPIGVGVAILRHQMFDIDLIINRTLVYASVTAILGGVYVGGIELIQRLFVFYTGQRSDTAIVITAFIVATVFTPVQKWVEGVVERRLGGRDPASRLDNLSSSVESVVRVIDPHRIANHLVGESVVAYEAQGGALYLHSFATSRPFAELGHLNGQAAIEIAVRHEKGDLGRLLLGRRRGHAPYSERDRSALQRSADALGEALAVAHDLGHVRSPTVASSQPPLAEAVASRTDLKNGIDRTSPNRQ